MSEDKHEIDVTLNESADPPVTFSKPDLVLKNKKTHKVIWKQADESEDFIFSSLTIDGETFNNPTDKKDPKSGTVLSDVNVGDKKITLKDKVGDEHLEFPYTVNVSAGGKVYSSQSATIRDTGGSARIRNEH